MGSGAKPADFDASLHPKEPGARLWQLRLQAGLTQSDDNWAKVYGLPPEPFTSLKHAVILLFADMERKGELD
jgi:hypothetical protein